MFKDQIPCFSTLLFSNLKARDPVILALCTQEAFQKSLEKAKRRIEREKKAKLREEKKAQAASV